MATDNLFLGPQAPTTFQFNASVTRVFDDMLSRSVPFYHQILQQIADLTASYVDNSSNSTLYDLGCSTGALWPVIQDRNLNLDYIGYDKSNSMIDLAKERYGASDAQFECQDLVQVSSFPNASVIVCHLVLQFIPLAERERVIQLCYQSLPEQGALIVVEKIKQSDPELQKVYNQAFYQFKMSNGYTKEEVLNKETSLKGVLMSETDCYYRDLFKEMGFSFVDTFFRWYNFVGYVVIK